MEFMVQKCTEIGITSFQPVLMERTNNQKINLHLIGKLQTNKVKFAVKLFDFITF